MRRKTVRGVPLIASTAVVTPYQALHVMHQLRAASVTIFAAVAEVVNQIHRNVTTAKVSHALAHRMLKVTAAHAAEIIATHLRKKRENKSLPMPKK